MSLALAIAVGVGIALAPTPAHAAPPTPLPGKAAVYGVVTPDTGGPVTGTFDVTLLSSGVPVATAIVESDGSYVLSESIDPGTYRIAFNYAGAGDWVRTYWAPPGGAQGDTFTLSADQVLEASGPIQLGASITGVVNVPTGLALGGVPVDLYDAAKSHLRSTTTDSSGAYSLSKLVPGTYYLAYGGGSGVVEREYWQNAETLATGTPVVVTQYATVYSGFNPSLSARPVITGTVLKELEGGGTAPAAGVTVRLLRLIDYSSFTTQTDSQGRYSLSTVGMFEFALAFLPDAESGLAPQYWEGKDSFEESSAFEIDSGGEYIPNIDATLHREGTVTGRVRYDLGAVSNLGGAEVWLYRVLDSGELDGGAVRLTPSNGTFSFDQLTPGQYILRATEGTGTRGLAPEYWNDAHTQESATRIEVVPGATASLGDIVLEEFRIETDRHAGADRFATGVEITRQQFPGPNPTVPVVYIANGLNYPDALTAGPAAIEKGGALLLVTPTGIPASVRAELDRLSPESMIIVGSVASVSADVEADLEAYVDSAADITRLGGADRFATSALVVREAFPDGAPNALFATGLNYPDALAAGPAAGKFGGPIILVNSSQPALDARTADLVTDLGVTWAYVLGSPATISNALQASIYDAMVPTGSFHLKSLGRLEGTDRYATAVRVNEFFFQYADAALLATGTGFADALSGGPLAGSRAIPMYLSTPSCLPTAVLESFYGLGITEVELLGGVGTLSNDVKNMVTC